MSQTGTPTSTQPDAEVTGMSESNIGVFLSVLERREPDNWEFHQDEKNPCWKVQYKGYYPPCNFHIEQGTSFIYLHAPIDIRVWEENRFAFYRYALRLNEEISGAKFGINCEGQLALMVEWYNDQLAFVGFETAVQIVLTYYRTYYADLQLVAQDAELARQITVREQSAQEQERKMQIQIERNPQT